MNDLENAVPVAPAVIGALVDLTGTAFAGVGSTVSVDLEDVEQLVAALHVLRPECAEIGFFDGWLCVARKEWDDAETIYRDLVVRSLCMPASSGMLLQCLKARETFGWQDEARKIVDQYASHEVGQLARTMLAADDVHQAIETAKRTGHFVPPESVQALEDANRVAAGGMAGAGSHASDQALSSSAQSANDMMMAMQYIRI